MKETENFKNAKEILEKYDPKALLESVTLRTMNVCSTPLPNSSPQRLVTNDSQLRYRSNVTPLRPLPALMPSPSQTSFRPMQVSGHQMRGPVMTPQRMVVMPPPLSTIKPILPQNRSIVEKVVDYMVSDGPNNRFALICMHCYSHNGMALKEEFEFIAYFCCYCKRFNPSRKAKPNAPRLQPLDQSKRSSLAPLIDEPESDTDSERGRTLTEDSTRIQEITVSSENLNNPNDVRNTSTEDQNKDLPENGNESKTEDLIAQTLKLELNDSPSDPPNIEEESVDQKTNKIVDQTEKEIPFIDDSDL